MSISEHEAAFQSFHARSPGQGFPLMVNAHPSRPNGWLVHYFADDAGYVTLECDSSNAEGGRVKIRPRIVIVSPASTEELGATLLRALDAPKNVRLAEQLVSGEKLEAIPKRPYRKATPARHREVLAYYRDGGVRFVQQAFAVSERTAYRWIQEAEADEEKGGGS